MATAFKLEERLLPMGGALTALLCVQSALKEMLPDADTVAIELADAPHRAQNDSPTLRAVITLKPLAELPQTLFVLRHDLVPDFRFAEVRHTQGTHKRHIVTAIIANA